MSRPPDKPKSVEHVKRTARYFAPCVGAFALVSPAAAQTAELPILKSADMNFTGLQFRDLELAEALPVAPVGEDFCVDLGQFAAAFEFPIIVDVAARKASGWIIQESDKFALDLQSGQVQIGEQTHALAENSVIPIDNGLCVAISSLQKWLPMTFNYDSFGSLLIVDSTETMPFEERLERSRRQEELSDAEKEIKISHEDVEAPDYRWFGIPSLAVSASTGIAHSGSDTTVSGSYSLAAVGEMLKMTSQVIMVSNAKLVPSSLSASLYRQDPYGGVFGIKALTEVAAGDIIGTGSPLISGTGSGRGVTLSSYPTGDADDYDRTSFSGNLPVGWEAELYRNGILIDFIKAGLEGRYEFRDVSVNFGKNDFKVVLYGPQGQRRETTKSINSSGFVVPRGKIYGRFSVVQLDSKLFEFNKKTDSNSQHPLQFGGDFKVGIASNISGGFGFSSFVRDEKRYWYGSTSAQANLGNVQTDVTLAAGSTGGLAGQLSATMPLGNGGIRVRYAETGAKFNTDRFLSGTKRSIELGGDQSFTFANGRRIPLSVTAQWLQNRDDSSNLNISAQTGLSFSGGSMSNNTRLSTIFAPTGETTTQASGTVNYNTQIGRYTLRGNLNYTLLPQTKIESLSVNADQQFSDGDNPWYLTGSAVWSFQSKTGDLAVTLNRQFEKFAASLSGNVNTQGGFGLNLALSFSLGRDPSRGSWRVSGENIANSASAVVRVFEDINQDNRFDAGDRLLPDAQLIVDGNTTETVTSKKGLAIIDNLPPYRPVSIGVDSSLMDNVDLVPSRLINGISARPGTMSYADLPMTVSGGVDGEILMLTGTGPAQLMAGITLQLVDTKGGIVTATKSGYDGFYIFEKVPAGEYNLIVQPEVLKALNAEMVGQRIVRVTRENPYPSGITVRMKRTSLAYVAVQANYNDILVDSRSAEIAIDSHTTNDTAGNFPKASPKLAMVASYSEDAEAPEPHIEVLTALFGDDVMNLPLPAPTPKPLGPSIVIIGPRYEDTLATSRQPQMTTTNKQPEPVRAPIS
jgi:hypothetical protein